MIQKRALVLAGIISVFTLIGAGCSSSTPAASTTDNSSTMQMDTSSTTPATSAVATTAITIDNFAFSPQAITVKVGDTVTWTNNDSTAHFPTSDDNSFTAGEVQPGAKVTATFSKAGTFTYHCAFHPEMTGTIIVQ